MKRLYGLISLWLIVGVSHAQIFPTYSQYFVTPVVYNPAFTGYSGFTEVQATYRQQWVGIDGAPETGTLAISVPTARNFSYGLLLRNDRRGLLTTSSAQGLASTFIRLGERQTLGVGIAIGVSNTALDLAGLDAPEYGPDIALYESLDGETAIQLGVGLFYEYSRFRLGVAMPTVVQRNQVDLSRAEQLGLNDLRFYLATMSYRLQVAQKVDLEPQLLYRQAQGVPGQYEAGMTFHYASVFWAGASYRQDYGISGYAGVHAWERLTIGYAYELGTAQVSGLPQGTHEVVVGIRLGRLRRERSQPRDMALAEAAGTNATQPKVSNATAEALATYSPAAQERLASDTTAVQGAVASNSAVVEGASAATELSFPPELTSPTKPRKFIGVDSKGTVAKTEGVANEMGRGSYVVVGSFRIPENAEQYAVQLNAQGINAEVGFHSTSHMHYVYVLHLPLEEIDAARQLKDFLRQEKGSDAWVLSLE